MRSRVQILGIELMIAVALVSTTAAAAPGDTEWISVRASDYDPPEARGTIGTSDDGRYVMFNLLPKDTDFTAAYVRDRVNQTSQLVSLGDAFFGLGLSGDGRYVLLSAHPGIYLRDRVGGTTTLLAPTGMLAVMNKHARYVAFSSDSTSLVPADTNGLQDVFLLDRQASTLERVSIATAGTQANAKSSPIGVSEDGRFVVFTSAASNLAASDTNGAIDVFVRDRLNRMTIRVSARADGTGGNGASDYASISADGRWVAFASHSSDLVPGDTNGNKDTFVRDLTTGQVERVSLSNSGGQVGGSDWFDPPSISDDGRFVTFATSAGGIVPGDNNYFIDVFVRDRMMQTTQRVSIASDGTPANGLSYNGTLSGDGRFVAFITTATNLDSRDQFDLEITPDVYMHERRDGVLDTLVVTPTALKFGQVAVGTRSATKTITVANKGTVALPLPWVNLRGFDTTEFRMVSRCPNPLPAGANCAIDVRFAPASAGAKQARVVVATGPDGLRDKVPLRGTGL
jgi:Tol biopolymer transport system component